MLVVPSGEAEGAWMLRGFCTAPQPHAAKSLLGDREVLPLASVLAPFYIIISCALVIFEEHGIMRLCDVGQVAKALWT